MLVSDYLSSLEPDASDDDYSDLEDVAQDEVRLVMRDGAQGGGPYF